ncbi:hypothetical protein M413DRAFT_449793, partial [Hebeloma cylindrosporum]
MAPAYFSLTTVADDDNEERLLAKSSEDFSSFRAEKPSPKVMLMAYILFALSVFFAGVNVAAGVKAIRAYQARYPPIDTLPRPNIFVGLPKNPQTGKHKANEQGHAHNHSHSN